MGIDQSYNGCAFVVTKEDEILDLGIIRSDKTADVYTRALSNAVQLHTVYEKHNPDLVGIEGLAFGMTGNVTRDLAGLLFTIVTTMTLKSPDWKYVIIPPTAVKKRGAGTGKAKKDEMINATPIHIVDKFKDYGVKKTTGLADLCDAYWINRCANDQLV